MGESLLFPCNAFSRCDTDWIESGRYRDDWAVKHFLHPKTLRKAREVRTQLLDIMKHQKLEIIPCGTDWDVIRCVLFIPRRSARSCRLCFRFAGKRSARPTSTRQLESRALGSTSTAGLEVSDFPFPSLVGGS